MKMLLLSMIISLSQFALADCKTEKTTIDSKTTEITLGGLNCKKAEALFLKNLKKMKVSQESLIVKHFEWDECYTEGDKKYTCDWNKKWIETMIVFSEKSYVLKTKNILCSQTIQERLVMSHDGDQMLPQKVLTICQFKNSL